MVIELLDQMVIVFFFRQQAPLIQSIMNVDVIGRGPLVTKIAIGMLCVFNLTKAIITAITHNRTKVLLFAP